MQVMLRLRQTESSWLKLRFLCGVLFVFHLALWVAVSHSQEHSVFFYGNLVRYALVQHVALS